MSVIWVMRISDALTFSWIFIALTLGYGVKRSLWHSLLIGIGCTVLGSLMILLQERLRPSYAVYQIIFLLCSILYGTTALRGQAGPKIVTAGLYCATFFLLYTVLPRGLPIITVRLLNQLMHGILIIFIGKHPLSSKRYIPVSYWLPMLMICLLMMAWPLSRLITMNAHIWLLQAVVALCLLTVLYLSYALCSKMIRNYERSLVQISMQGMNNREAALREENQRLNEALRRGRHELINHFGTLSALIEQGKSREALNLLSQIELPAAAHTVCSGNAIADAIFERYAALARQQHIAFTAKACLDEALPVADADLSSLLNNLLSNAFDASSRVEQPEVEMHVYPVKDYLCIFARNKADKAQLKANPQLHTTKRNPEMHGIGLQVVREIAEKYHGWVDISTEEARFTVQIMLLVEPA